MMKVLIADDELGIRSLVRMTLTDSRYEIVEAKDGEEALNMARRENPRIVFLDVNMPKRSGLEVCRALKGDAAAANMTIVMLTAMGQEADVEAGFEAGADDYFTKPFSPIALLRKVDEILDAAA